MIIKITINRIDWEVLFTSSDNALLIDNNGTTAYEECKIYMRRDMNQSKTRRILIHELTHAVEYSFGLKDRASEDRHEDLADFLMYYADFIVATAGDIMAKVIEIKGIYA